ncbi:threonine--tRNA ligase [Spirochaeta dissipatitropha]
MPNIQVQLESIQNKVDRIDPPGKAWKELTADEKLYKIRHSLSHILAQAVLDTFPDAQLAIGPAISTGFYYDFDLPAPLKEDQLPAIEERMREIVKQKVEFKGYELPKDEARKVLKGQVYKEELLEDLPEGEKISFYVQDGFTDLCAGNHVEHSGQIDPKSFKLMSVAGAYWRGDEKRPMLTRIYGAAFQNGKELRQYLEHLKEVEKRDHRRLGRELDLFHFEPDNPGQIFWHHKGWSIYRTLQEFIRRNLAEQNYQEVNTPSVMPKGLWDRSGHWEKYHEHMFITESEKRLFALKPMNCPGHIEIFKQGLKSYRDLPLRMAEFGSCTRNESSGALHGIMRVRGFVQDDAHIFCTEEQISSEVILFTELLKKMYAAFGFTDENIIVKFSTRPEIRVGDDASWDRAEAALAAACDAAGLKYDLAPGEGAFYGPKLEFTLVDALGREWQCGTIQVDYQLPSKERLDAGYIGEDGDRHTPIILHRAVLGSLERFIGILIEHFAGAFPVWLSPVQAMIIPVAAPFFGYAEEVQKELKSRGIRAEVDLSDDRLNAKIRSAQTGKIPYAVIVGEREQEERAVSVRKYGGTQENGIPLDSWVSLVAEKIETKDLEL